MCGEPEQLAALPAGQLAAAVRVAAALGDGALAGLLARGAPVNEPDHGGFMALMYAARAGWDTVSVLIDGGVEVDQVNRRGTGYGTGKTALNYAAEAGRAKAVSALRAAGAVVDNARDDGATPLFMSAQNGHAEVVAALLWVGAAVDKAMNNGATPLFVSAYKGHATVVAALLAAGANKEIKTPHGTPLDIARSQGHAKVVALLQ